MKNKLKKVNSKPCFRESKNPNRLKVRNNSEVQLCKVND